MCRLFLKNTALNKVYYKTICRIQIFVFKKKTHLANGIYIYM